MKLGRLASAATAFGLAAATLAHDFWIQPLSFSPRVGELVKIDLRIGDDVPGESFPRKASIIERFEIVDPGGKSAEIVGRDAQSPAGLARPTVAGLHVVGYRSKSSSVDLEAAKFEQYLREKGLEKVIEARAAAGKSAENGREMFSRCAKCIVSVGDVGSGGFDRVLGHTLEIIADNDPTRLKPGDVMKAHLVFKENPCGGVLVLAKSLGDGKTVLQTRTDAEGRFEFALPVGGKWMLTAVEMVQAPGGVEINGVKPEWESLWASLSFETVAVAAQTGAKK